MNDELYQEDFAGWRGPFSSGRGPHASGEGVFNGGGWINGPPLGVSVESGYGPWTGKIADDPQTTVGPVGSAGDHEGDYFYNLVDGWGSAGYDGNYPRW